MNPPPLRVILLGGTSNVGKSTLAQSLARRLAWECVSTDSLGRHPGRPWGEVKPHVAEHYLSLSPDELMADVVRHYTGMWPGVRSLIASRAADDAASAGLVLEGSALLPELVAELRLDHVGALWLTASDALLEQRIRDGSDFPRRTPREHAMIGKFIARTHCYNRMMMDAVTRLRLPWLDVERTASLENLTDEALNLLRART